MIGSLLANQRRKYDQMPNEERQRLKSRLTEIQIGPFGWLIDFASTTVFGDNLKQLATIYMSDKWNVHWYAQHYEDHFRRMRHNKLNLLEIGIGGYTSPRMGGGSLRMWQAYFQRGHIYGLDIHDKSAHNRGRIKTFRGSQVDPVFLDSVIKQIGPIDIIIDDGSHRNDHVTFTFRHLFPHLADGGFYAIEDTQTSYWPDFAGNPMDRNDSATTMGFFKSLTDGLNYAEFTSSHSPDYYDLNIKSIFFYHNLIIIRKGVNR